MSAHVSLELNDLSQVGEARRLASQLARGLEFGEADVGRVALAVTEVATNVIKHARGGQLLMMECVSEGGAHGMALIALDQGPGMTNPTESMRDGFSTTGTSGTGLGAIRRQSNLFEMYTLPGRGTAVLFRIWPEGGAPPSRALQFGAVSIAYPGEEVCGDGWSVMEVGRSTKILVVDGLGHGIQAHEAAEAARATFRACADLPPFELVVRLHEALRPTRGAALTVTEIDRDAGIVKHCGIGNVAGSVLVDGAVRHMVSMHGTAGHDVRKTQQFQYPWSRESLLVLHTDGIATHWNLEGYAGLGGRHPALVAAVLYRDFRRGRDDATLVVAREAA